MCTDQWEGQHCEQKKMATAITTSEVSSEATETSARERKASTTKVNTLEAGLLAGSLVLLVAIILCALSMFYRYKQRAKMAESAAAFLGAERNYKDESNISPYRDSAADPIPNMHYTSSSDPYSTMIVDGETTRQVSRIANPRLLVAFEGDEHDQLRPVEIC